jgi:hypothetical protein
VDAVNPHYLRFHGQTATLISSGEHYGAVLNSAFDYINYLDTLHENKMNLARVLNGTFVEPLDDLMFPGGDQNTLAPRTGRYLAPWARTGAPGYTGGGSKFDLTRWDDEYFTRLKSFVAEAGKREIAVEVTLFSTNYGTGKSRWGGWSLNPLNAANNINQVGDVTWDRFNTMENAALVAAQDAVVRKTVAELNGFDNVYYEICNEPYFSGASVTETRDWIKHITGTIQAAEAALPNKHLIAENFAASNAPLRDPNPAVSIYNFHSANPAVIAPVNWSLRKPVAMDQTLNGCATLDRRRDAWTFLMSGGAIYNNLDAAFTTDDAAGTGQACDGVRYALRILAQFMAGLDLSHMQQDYGSVSQLPQFASEVWLLDDPGRSYALYFKGGSAIRSTALLLEAPAGKYQIEWMNPRTGESVHGDAVDHGGGAVRIQTPDYAEDLAMKMVRTGDLPVNKPAPAPKTRPVGKKGRG